MFERIVDRAKEPTTYLGLAQLVMAFGMLFKINEAPGIAHAVEVAAHPLAAGDYATGGALLLSGILGIFLSEKKG